MIITHATFVSWKTNSVSEIMPFTQPGSTTAVVSGRFWTTFGCQMLHVLKICCRDRALYVGLVFKWRNAIFTYFLHAACIHIGPTRMRIHRTYTSLWTHGSQWIGDLCPTAWIGDHKINTDAHLTSSLLLIYVHGVKLCFPQVSEGCACHL